MFFRFSLRAPFVVGGPFLSCLLAAVRFLSSWLRMAAAAAPAGMDPTHGGTTRFLFQRHMTRRLTKNHIHTTLHTHNMRRGGEGGERGREESRSPRPSRLRHRHPAPDQYRRFSYQFLPLLSLFSFRLLLSGAYLVLSRTVLSLVD